jgi:hypothetical protein
MTTAVENPNGRVRKSLASQIDRLDSILDGLSEALTESVAEAVERGVAKVLTELLTNPALAERIHVPSIPAGQDESQDKTLPPSSAGSDNKANGVLQAGYQRVKRACGSVIRQASRLAGVGQPFLGKLLRSRLLAYAGALGLVGLIGFFAGPKVPILITAAVGWVTGIIARVKASFRRSSLDYLPEPG